MFWIFKLSFNVDILKCFGHFFQKLGNVLINFLVTLSLKHLLSANDLKNFVRRQFNTPLKNCWADCFCFWNLPVWVFGTTSMRKVSPPSNSRSQLCPFNIFRLNPSHSLSPFLSISLSLYISSSLYPFLPSLCAYITHILLHVLYLSINFFLYIYISMHTYHILTYIQIFLGSYWTYYMSL